MRPVVAVPLVDNARDPGLDEQMRVVAHEGARGVDDLLGVYGVSQEVDGDDSRVVVDEVDRKGEAMRRGRKRPAQIGRDTLAKVSVDASVGGVIGVPLAPPVEKARGAILAASLSEGPLHSDGGGSGGGGGGEAEGDPAARGVDVVQQQQLLG